MYFRDFENRIHIDRERVFHRELRDIEAESFGEKFFRLRDGDRAPLQGIFYHNHQDLLALASLTVHMAGLCDEPERHATLPAEELAAAAKRRPDNRRGFSAGLLKRARAGGMPVLKIPWWRGGKTIDDAFVLGWDTAGRGVALEGKQREFHVLVAGMTGKGKTVFMCAVIARAWLMGWSVVVIDLKGSATARRLFSTLAFVRAGAAR